MDNKSVKIFLAMCGIMVSGGFFASQYAVRKVLTGDLSPKKKGDNKGWSRFFSDNNIDFKYGYPQEYTLLEWFDWHYEERHNEFITKLDGSLSSFSRVFSGDKYVGDITKQEAYHMLDHLIKIVNVMSLKIPNNEDFKKKYNEDFKKKLIQFGVYHLWDEISTGLPGGKISRIKGLLLGYKIADIQISLRKNPKIYDRKMTDPNLLRECEKKLSIIKNIVYKCLQEQLKGSQSNGQTQNQRSQSNQPDSTETDF